MSRRGEAYIQIRRGKAGTVLYSRIAIEPHRFDREVRGRGRAGSRPAHRRRACDRHDPAPVSRDLHNPRPPRDGAGLLPRAPDRKRRGLESNRCGRLRGRLRAPALAIDSADHPVGRIRRVPAVARSTFATSHRSLRERDRAAPGRRRGGRPSNLRPPLLAPSRDWALRRLRSVLCSVARTDSVRLRFLRLFDRGPEPAVPALRGCAGNLELRRDRLGRPSNRTRGASSPTRLRRSDARVATSGITRPGSHLLLLRGARDHHRRRDPQPGPRPPGIPRVPDRLGPVRCRAVVPPACFDPSAHGDGEASRKRYREFEGRRGLCAAHGQEPDVGTEPPRSARPAPPHARDPSAPGGGTPNPDPAHVAVRDAGNDPHRRDHLDGGRRRGGTRRGRLFPPAVEPVPAPSVLSPDVGMRTWVPSMRCDACGTMNKETSRFCLYCGASLTTAGTAAAPVTPASTASPAPPPLLPRAAPLRPVYVPRPRTPDFVGLFGVAFFFLVLGVVFYLNGNLLTELRRWWDQILAGRAAFRPPEGLIVSAGLFWGLLGVSNFGIGFLRWFFTRSRIRTLGALLGGIAMVTFSYFLYRYSLRDMRS